MTCRMGLVPLLPPTIAETFFKFPFFFGMEDVGGGGGGDIWDGKDGDIRIPFRG